MAVDSQRPATGHPGEATRSAADPTTLAQPVGQGKETLRPCQLVVIEGVDAGTVLSLDRNAPSRILLGTGPACELRLTDPMASRRHCALEPMGARYKITDLGSTNGTFVDGVAVVEAFVRGDETIRVGSSALRVTNGVAPDSPPLPSAMRFGRVMGASVAMRRLYPLCERLARSRIPLIIEGETGTGKEALAESIHEAESSGPFVVFDCTTVSPSLVEAQLFGHERGAFTGAVTSRPGVFEEANGGTLLIDEIGDLDLALQAKLLRVIDRGELRRIGGQKSISIDVRILAATRRDLDKAVAAERFRDDLFHRLAVARIELPPLRERYGDVALLARHFARAMGAPAETISTDVLARFDDYSWPGNIRELRNAVARLVALGDIVVPSQGASAASSTGNPDGWLESILANNVDFSVARRKTLDEFERRYVERLLRAHNGNVSQAARASGLALRYFRLVKARQSE